MLFLCRRLLHIIFIHKPKGDKGDQGERGSPGIGLPGTQGPPVTLLSAFLQ